MRHRPVRPWWAPWRMRCHCGCYCHPCPSEIARRLATGPESLRRLAVEQPDRIRAVAQVPAPADPRSPLLTPGQRARSARPGR